MRLRLWKRRLVKVEYAEVIDFRIPDECDTLEIGMLTGDLTLNLFDPSGQSGDYLKILLQVDEFPHSITVGGPQGAPGSFSLTAGVAVIFLVFHAGIGQYASVVAPG